MNDTDDLAAWVRLMDTEGVGPQTARELLGRFGMPSEIFGAGFSALQNVCLKKSPMHSAHPSPMNCRPESTGR